MLSSALSDLIYIRGRALHCTLADHLLAASARKIQKKSYALSEELIFPYLAFADDSAADLFQCLHKVVGDVISDAKLTKSDLSRSAFFLGSTSFSLAINERAYRSALQNNELSSAFSCGSYNAISEYLQEQFAPQASCFTFNTACTSSANAMIYAAEQIKHGEIDHAIIIGSEFYNETTALGFLSLDLLSKQGMQPFGQERDGLILGEGCSAIVLSRENINNGAYSYKFLGGATAGDTYSMTSTKPDGSAIAMVIEQALSRANLVASDIDGIKLHGTASLANDDTEFAGLNKVFDSIPACCALKPLIGHTLGACGSNELVLLLAYLDQDRLPGLPELYVLDDMINPGLLFENQLLSGGKQNFLLNYFGFGGNNTALVIQREFTCTS